MADSTISSANKFFYYMYKSQASKARSLSFCRYFFFGIGGGVVLYSHNEC
jgi:hypothetical protein